MAESFIDVLVRKIEERQRLDQRPMGTLTPGLHPAEVMALQLLARPISIAMKPSRTPYGKKTAAPASPSPTKILLPSVTTEPKERVISKKETRPTPKVPMGVKEVVARELFVKWGFNLETTPLKKEISKAFKKLAFKLHPDRSKEPDAGKSFADLTEAYQILKAWADKAY